MLLSPLSPALLGERKQTWAKSNKASEGVNRAGEGTNRASKDF